MTQNTSISSWSTSQAASCSIKSLSSRTRHSVRRKLQVTWRSCSRRSIIATPRELFTEISSPRISWSLTLDLCVSSISVCRKLGKETVIWPLLLELHTIWHLRFSKETTDPRQTSGHWAFWCTLWFQDIYPFKEPHLLKYSERSKKLISTSITKSSTLFRMSARSWSRSYSSLTRRNAWREKKLSNTAGSRHNSAKVVVKVIRSLVCQSAMMSSTDWDHSRACPNLREPPWTFWSKWQMKMKSKN